MPKLVVDTKKNIFEPIEVEIDGELYSVEFPISTKKLEEFFKFGNDINDPQAGDKQLMFILPELTQEKLDTIPDYRFKKDTLDFIVDNLINFKKKETKGKK